ncbi:nucleotidyltransferase domain-containing protein [Ectothiorhodospira lacustris]|uniref:nucleotidyltransferase domain-containing protein n=1 Tax=Ectothiorhodospira lacustris TaxID=2899127 RepID=UPI001EE85F48|nr:nucleotidyltransferase family protein [Ectothiorhodospira lacustris]MCG5510370.1 nucleotidyltransferase family protein [Ectothiorhodospira lacustris]MCG5522116.1 nucleotidyltransferase family protein [Ectothiorhodospira lacustris]
MPLPDALDSGKGLLVSGVLNPEALGALSPGQWDVLIRQARLSRLLGRLAMRFNECGLLASVPVGPRQHLEWAIARVNTQTEELRWELSCIEEALAGLDVPVILLKGAAYHVADLAFARGRLFGDIDIMVAPESLPRVEAALMLKGWANSHHDAYDQRYYREWMHELPPMQHIRRGTTLDVHHSILPPTARLKTRPGLLMDAAVTIEGCFFKVLAPEDRVLHSATHLFFSEGEMAGGLRDLLDLDGMVRGFSGGEDWQRLLRRAAETGLERPLFMALHYLDHLVGTPVPGDVLDQVRHHYPAGLAGAVLDWGMQVSLAPSDTLDRGVLQRLSEWLLIVRGHWQKMPLHLLMMHLGRKALVRQS